MTTPSTPTGSLRTGGWYDDGQGCAPSRSVLCSNFDGGNVAVDGRQWPDGTTDAAVSVDVSDGQGDDELMPHQARAIGTAQHAAADAAQNSRTVLC